MSRFGIAVRQRQNHTEKTTMDMMKTYTIIAASCCLVLLGSEPGRSQTRPGRGMQTPLPQSQAPVVTNCWTETQTFSNLTTGDVDFCKKHMRYTPGAPDCYVFETQVCDLFQPANQQWTQNRRPLAPRVMECPEEPEPPLCPSSPSLRW